MATKIKGAVTVTDSGTWGHMETPFVTVTLDGQRYDWISESASPFMYLPQGERLEISAFVRELRGSLRLFRVNATYIKR